MPELLLLPVFVVIWIAVRFTRPVFADLKCGDAPPVRFAREGLVIAWTGPVPAGARVRLTSKDAFRHVSETMGPVRIEEIADRYAGNHFEAEVFNASMAWDTDGVRRWNQRHGMKISDQPLTLFREYLDTGEYAIFQSLVEHPEVSDFESYSACSVVAQRGDIYFTNGRQDLYLQSQFHSAKSATEFVDFAPAQPLHISFATDTIWYPLRVTKLNREPTKVVLNILTPDPLRPGQIPANFKLEKLGRLRVGVQLYSVAQISGTFEGGQDVPDLSLRP